MEIALRGLQICVFQDVADGDWVEDSREQGAGGVAEVVEAQRWEAGGVASRDVAPAECGVVEPVADDAGEDLALIHQGARTVPSGRERRMTS